MSVLLPSVGALHLVVVECRWMHRPHLSPIICFAPCLHLARGCRCLPNEQYPYPTKSEELIHAFDESCQRLPDCCNGFRVEVTLCDGLAWCEYRLSLHSATAAAVIHDISIKIGGARRDCDVPGVGDNTGASGSHSCAASFCTNMIPLCCDPACCSCVFRRRRMLMISRTSRNATSSPPAAAPAIIATDVE
jgi:hypothetical protein